MVNVLIFVLIYFNVTFVYSYGPITQEKDNLHMIAETLMYSMRIGKLGV